jgi:hypothetical protein
MLVLLNVINAGASGGYSSVHQPEGRPGAFVYPMQRVQDLAFLQRQVGVLFLYQLAISEKNFLQISAEIKFVDFVKIGIYVFLKNTVTKNCIRLRYIMVGYGTRYN